ncbi:Gfo/Idh/MocA family oxidoreductase [Polaribacter sp.]|nr:Gfo/Idh/MocA family oxidoreductase [Polaribacter sp.]
MKKNKFGIIGCGRIGNRHAEHASTYGELVAVCDTDEHKAKSIADKYNCKFYTSIKDLLLAHSEIDCISICTPNGLHAEHSILSFKNNFNVLCEKPLAINSHDAAEMLKASENANKRLFAVKQNRFNPPVKAVKDAIEEGRFGNIYSFQLTCFWNRNDDYYKNSWKGSRELDGGTLFTQFSHFIDLIYWMFGDIKSSQGFSANTHHQNTIEFEDSGVVVLKCKNGIMGTVNYSVNCTNQNMEGSLTIIGEKGTVKIGGQYLNELEYSQFSNGYQFPKLEKGNTSNNYGQYQGSMSNHDHVYKNLVEVLNDNAIINTNAFEAYKIVEIIENIYENIR